MSGDIRPLFLAYAQAGRPSRPPGVSFSGPASAGQGRGNGGCCLAEGADARRGAEQGGSGLPRRVSTLVSPCYVQNGRYRSVVPSLRPLCAGRKRVGATFHDGVHVLGKSAARPAGPDVTSAEPNVAPNAPPAPAGWMSRGAAVSSAPGATSPADARRPVRARGPAVAAAGASGGRLHAAGPGPGC